jgi:DNA-binding FrmR family transcriptional regulator
MAHTIRHKKKLVLRVRRIRGQVEAIERALTGEMDCSAVLQRITACRGAIDGLLSEVLEDHVRFHIIDQKRHRDADPRDAGKEILDIIRMYLR